jgi:hypothetical protein
MNMWKLRTVTFLHHIQIRKPLFARNLPIPDDFCLKDVLKSKEKVTYLSIPDNLFNQQIFIGSK